LPFESNGDTIFFPHGKLTFSPPDNQYAELNKHSAVVHASPFKYFGGTTMISFPFLFVFAPFIVLSLMILFAGKPGK